MNINVENVITKTTVPGVIPMAFFALGSLTRKINEANLISVRSDKEDSIPIWKKYALTIPEAAKYFGIGEKRLYQIIAEHQGADFILEIGTHVKIKRELFSKFLDLATCV